MLKVLPATLESADLILGDRLYVYGTSATDWGENDTVEVPLRFREPAFATCNSERGRSWTRQLLE
jgi:hypothetical protein